MKFSKLNPGWPVTNLEVGPLLEKQVDRFVDTGTFYVRVQDIGHVEFSNIRPISRL